MKLEVLEAVNNELDIQALRQEILNAPPADRAKLKADPAKVELALKAIAIGKIVDIEEDTMEVRCNAFNFECGDLPVNADSFLFKDYKDGFLQQSLLDTYEALYNAEANSFFTMPSGVDFVSCDLNERDFSLDTQIAAIARVMFTYSIASQKDIDFHYFGCIDEELLIWGEQLDKMLRVARCKHPIISYRGGVKVNFKTYLEFHAEKIKQSTAERLFIVINRDVDNLDALILACHGLKGDKQLLVLVY